MKNYQNFYDYLEEFPNDWEFREVFSDWLFDHNMISLQNTQKFLIQNKTHACLYEEKYRMFLYCKDLRNIRYANFDLSKSSLPTDIFNKIPVNKVKDYGTNDNYWRYYFSLREAEEALAKALFQESL